MCGISGASWPRRFCPSPPRRPGSPGGPHRARGGPALRVAGLRYDGRHRVGDALATQLRDAAARSVGQHHAEVYRVEVRYTCEDLDVLRRGRRALGRDSERLGEAPEVGRLLTTIPGIGPQTSARLVATFRDFSSF